MALIDDSKDAANTGVLAATRWSDSEHIDQSQTQQFLDTWYTTERCRSRNLWKRWPWEQGCLSEVFNTHGQAQWRWTHEYWDVSVPIAKTPSDSFHVTN